MLTQTSELAIRSLIYIGLEGGDEPLSPKRFADYLECSPSYLAKTIGMLVRSGILRSVRGAQGGVLLARSPDEITLLDIVEACQGLLVGNYCQAISGHIDPVCAFHAAMREVHQKTTETLSGWTLADLLETPTSENLDGGPNACKMKFRGCEKYLPGKGRKKKVKS